MKSLKIFSISIVVCLCAIVDLYAFEKIPIAVMDFKVTNFQKSESDLFVDFFNNALFETGVFDVLQRNQRDRLLQEIQFSMSDTADAKLTRQVGKLLSSKLLVFGNLGKVGKNVLLSVSMVDVETGRTVSSYSKTYKSLEEVFNSLPEASSALADPAAQSVFMKKTRVLYFDDFEEQKWVVSDKLYYKDGKYHIFSKDSMWYIWHQQSFEDFSVECEATFTTGPKNGVFGILFRLQDADNFYGLHITHDGMYTVYKYVEGKTIYFVPWVTNTAINTVSTNILKITAFRSRFSVFINNVKVKEFTDQTFHDGKVGLIASQETDVAFDNLIVYQGNLVFYDYFSKPSENFSEGKAAYTKNGVYNVDGKLMTAPYITWNLESRKNFSLKADAEYRSGGVSAGYGICVRVVDAGNTYSFFLSKDGYYRFGYTKNFSWTSLIDWKKSRLINPDGRNILRVECVDDTFYLYINENLVETVTDTTFKEGGFGFITEAGVNASFDNAELFDLN
ncbi:MAG: hypothetical protein JXD23_11760 [Spirochaetales bacterium]|nr:hypothetical protein [Spirochaetales bacterium]